MIKFLIIIVMVSTIGCNSARYYTLDDYGKVKKIDTHVHIHTDRDIFVDQAKADNFQLVTISLDPQSKWDKVKEEHRYGQLHAANHPETVVHVTSFSIEGWDEEDWTDSTMEWLNTAIDEGAVGVKVWKNIGMVYRDSNDELVMIDDPKFDPIFDMLTSRNIPVVGHLGEPKNCWLPLEEMTTNNDSSYFSRNPQYHMYLHPELPSYEDQIDARDRFLEKNPGLTFIGAHAGSLEWDVDALAERLDRFPKMSVDLAARMGQIFYQTSQDWKKVRDFFIKYQDRIEYATDLGDSGKDEPDNVRTNMHDTWYRDWEFFVTDNQMESDLVDVPFKGLKLPKEVIDKIFYENARRWFGVFDVSRS